MTLYRKEFRLRKKVLEYTIIGIAIDRMDIAMLRKKFPIIFLNLKFCLKKLYFSSDVIYDMRKRELVHIDDI